MKKYRARYDSPLPHATRSWLTNTNHIHCDSEAAAVGPLNYVVNLIADMVKNEPKTVERGLWVIERKRDAWSEVQ